MRSNVLKVYCINCSVEFLSNEIVAQPELHKEIRIQIM